MLYLLAGPDDFSLNNSLQEIKKRLGDAAVLATCTTVLDGQKVTADEFRNACETIPFLAEKRLVIIDGLIERFEGGARSERPRTGRAAKPQDASPFVNCLSTLPESTVAVIVENAIPNLTKGAFKELAGKAEIKTFPLLKEPRLRSWVQKRATETGVNMSPAAVDVLLQLAGSNLWVMANEIDKLAAFAKGRRIEDEDVKSLVGYSQDVDVFAMIDAIVDFKVDLAAQVLQQLLRQGAAPPYLLFMLDRQFRLIIRAKDMKARGTPEIEIQNKLGLYNDFAFRRTTEQAGRYSLTRIIRIYQQLLEADLSMKTGRYDSDLVLNLLVAELCQRTPDGQRSQNVGSGYADD